MKVEFTLKAKEMDKKWHKAIKKLFGKKKLCITVKVADEDDDNWWEDEDEDGDDWFLEWDEEDQDEQEESEDEKEEESEDEKEAQILEAAGVEAKEEEKVAETPVVEGKKKRGPNKKQKEEVASAEEAPVKPKRPWVRRNKPAETPVVTEVAATEEKPKKTRAKKTVVDIADKE